MNWDQVRNEDGSINLLAAYELKYAPLTPMVSVYLNALMELQPIKSRQTAALAIATAYYTL
jgi:hypothetical protein